MIWNQGKVVVVAVSSMLCLNMLVLIEYIYTAASKKPLARQRTALCQREPGGIQEKEDAFEGVDLSFMMDNVINCSRPFIMVEPLGQLGNKLGESSNLIALKLKYNVQVGVRRDMYDHMKATFPNFPLPPLPKECTKRTDIHIMTIHRIENYVALNGLDISIRIGHYACHPAFFMQYRNLLRFFYRFYSSVQQSAERYRDLLLEKWRKKMEAASLKDETVQAPSNELPLVIGVHVRRTDYVRHMRNLHGSEVMNHIFFRDAFAFARRRYGTVAFIVVSDDLPWCHENIVQHHPDAVALDDPISRDEDMALMALSDHLIYDLGTFGLFGGLLSKGDVIYAANVSYDLERPYDIEAGVSEVHHENLIPFLLRKPY